MHQAWCQSRAWSRGNFNDQGFEGPVQTCPLGSPVVSNPGLDHEAHHSTTKTPCQQIQDMYIVQLTNHLKWTFPGPAQSLPLLDTLQVTGHEARGNHDQLPGRTPHTSCNETMQKVSQIFFLEFSGRPLGFYRISTTKKNPRISTKYRPHSTLSTKYRPQKFLEKRTFTIFTFKS